MLGCDDPWPFVGPVIIEVKSRWQGRETKNNCDDAGRTNDVSVTCSGDSVKFSNNRRATEMLDGLDISRASYRKSMLPRHSGITFMARYL